MGALITYLEVGSLLRVISAELGSRTNHLCPQPCDLIRPCPQQLMAFDHHAKLGV